MVNYTANGLPIIEPGDFIADGVDNLRADINSLATATEVVLSRGGARMDITEAALSSNGTLVTNMALDPVPAIADFSTYSGSRVTLEPVSGRGRATCYQVGSSSFFPRAAVGSSGLDSRYPARQGSKVSSTVTLTGHPTVAMGIIFSVQAYRWDGAAFVSSNVPTPFATTLTQLAAGSTATFELAGVMPTSDATHIIAQVQFRRWGSTYPEIGDYVEWSNWAVQTGGSALDTLPVPYIDGSRPDGYWLGTPNQSPSRGILIGEGGSVYNSAKREALVSEFKARRGGVLGTDGKLALAIRCDHGLANFESKVLPIFQKYDFPWSQAINPATLWDSLNQSTFAELQQWAIDNGGEVWNHGRTHQDAVGRAAIRTEIETSLKELQEGMPALAIEGWAPPGVGAGGYGGYSPMDTPEKHWNTFAGQLVLSNHAAIAGYIQGLYRTLPADLPIGLVHGTLDSQTPATVASWISGSMAAGGAIQLMLHPALVDTPGYITTADLDAMFANIASLRDAGSLEVLTPSGLLLADQSTAYRHNLISNGNFTEAAVSPSWASATGWTVAQGAGFRYATTTTGAPLTQLRSMSRKEAHLGGARELVYMVRATAGAVVRTAAMGTGISATKDHTLAASSQWVEVRKTLVIPRNFSGNLTVNVGRVSGGVVDITNVRLQTI